MEAWSLHAKTHPNDTLELRGNGPDRAQWEQRWGHLPGLSFGDGVPREDVERAFCNWDTLVVNSPVETFGLAAAEALEAEGISAEVIDLRSIRPLDHATLLQSVRKTHRMVVVDESWPFASVSSEIAYRIQKDAFDELDAPVVRVNGADVPMSYSMPLVAAYLPSVEKVVRAVKEVMYLRK